MGYELDRLMQQYGVSTPGLMNAPTAPVSPTAPAPLEEGADDATTRRHAEATTAYNAALAAQPAAMEAYRANAATYEPYAQEYLRRLRDTPMYLQSQFAGPTTATVPPAMTFSPAQMSALSPSGIGMDAMQRNVQNYFRTNPNATPEQIAAAQQQWGVSDRDIRNAMGPGFSYGQGISGYGSTGLNYATAPGGIGQQQYYSNIRDWIAAHPNASYADILEEANRWGVDNRDLMAATGSYWGGRLRSPVFVSPPAPAVSIAAPTVSGVAPAVSSEAPAVSSVANMNESADGGGMDADAGGSSIGQGVSNTATSIGLGLMGVPGFGLVGMGLNALGGAIAGQQADAMGEAAANLGAIEAMGLPGVVAVSDPSGNTFSFSSPATIAASDEADFGLDGVTAGDSPGDSGDGSSGVGGAGVGAAGGTGTGSAGEGPGWAKGGLAKLGQKYALGGRTRMGYDSPESEQDWQSYWATQGTPAEPSAVTDYAPAPAMSATRSMAPAMPMSVEAPDAAALQAPPPMPTPPATVTPVSPAAADLMSMLNRYQGAEGRPAYADELGRARRRYESETEAFNSMLAKALQPDGEKPDKSEMYFRLAAAFGAPTKTGHFTESLGAVGRELGELKKEERMTKRAERQARLQLGLEAQKMRTQAARDEMTAARAIASEEAKDRRAVLAEYLRSGRPQSEAGKAAIDAGLQQGTPEFTNYVNKYLDEKISSGNAIREAMAAVAAGQLQVAQQGLSLRQQAEQRAATKAQSEAGQLSPTELKMKLDAEQSLGGLEDSMSALRRAYSLNPQTVEGTLAGTARLKLLEQLDPEDPRVLATREQRNLLSKGAIEKLRSSFGGNPTEGERAALLDLEGLDSKSREERARIMRNTYDLLKARLKREQARLEDIKAGRYRQKTPTPAVEELD